MKKYVEEWIVMRPLPLRVTRRILVCAVWLSSCLVCAAHADNVADSVGNVIWDYAAGERTTISRYGNWLGPGWWGGSELSSRVGMLPPVDDLDAVAQKHDFGYELAEKLGKGRPNVEAYYKSVADMIAIRDTMTLNPDPTKWAHPAANPEQAKIFMDRLRIGFTYYQQKMHELKAGLPNAPADIADPEILDNVIDGILDEKQLEAQMLMRISRWEREHRKWQATKKAQAASAQGGQQSWDGQKISGEPSKTGVGAQQTDASAHADLLNAICRCTSSCTARVYYSTTPVAESPSCNDPSNGPCVCSGMGCMRSVMSPLCVVKKYQEAKGQQLNVGNVLNFIDKYSGPKPAAQDPASIFPLVRKGEALHLYIKSPGKEEEKWLWQSNDARTFRATRLSPGTAPSTEIVNLKKPSMGHLIFERPGGGKILAMRDVMNGGFQDGITDNVPAGTTVVGVVTPDTAPQTPEPGPQTAAGSEPVDEEGSGASGYELYFDGKLVSGPDAAYYTRQQAQENCDWNMQTKPQIRIRCVYNGALLRERQPKEPQGSGYELYFEGKLVSGPDAAYYTLKQAQENCDWNRRTKPHIHIDCVYNGRPLRE